MEPELTPPVNGRTGNAVPDAAGRLLQWQRRLLDLTLRNPLLNMRSQRSLVSLIAPDVGALEDRLAEGKALAITALPVNALPDPSPPETAGRESYRELAAAALAKGKLLSPLDATSLDKVLIDLYRRARNDLTEGGANTLFLGVGVLYWQRPDDPERSYRAPLVLIPVNLTRQTVRSGVRITQNDDEARFNTTLLELLRQDFGLPINGLDGALPADHSGADISAILTRFRDEIRVLPGFQVREEVVLGTFSFAKYLLWKDLVDRTDHLRGNAVVRHLLDTPRQPFAQTGTFRAPHSFDDTLATDAWFTPLHHDSSQLAAVVAAAEGKHFVMIGPPGTGKSQTIANLIAHNLGAGRTVLFVAEKAAALEVVYRRLKAQGLGEFCLELHSNKARKLDVLSQLQAAWQTQTDNCEPAWQAATGQLQALRNDLNQLVNALHHPHTNGFSLRSALDRAVQLADAPAVPLSWPSVDQHDAAAVQTLFEAAEQLDVHAQDVGALPDHPLRAVLTNDWSLAGQQRLLTQLATLQSHAQRWHDQLHGLTQRLGLGQPDLTSERVSALARLVSALLAAAGNDLAAGLDSQAASFEQSAQSALGSLEVFQRAWPELSCAYQRDLLVRFDPAPVSALWQSTRERWWLPRWLGAWQCRRLLRQQAGAQAAPDLARDIPRLVELCAAANALAPLHSTLQTWSGWRGLDTDTEQLHDVLRISRTLRVAAAELSDTPEQLAQLRATMRAWVVDANDMLASTGALGKELADCQKSGQQVASELACSAPLLGYAPDQLLTALGSLTALLALCTTLQRDAARLKPWCAWRRVRQHAIGLGLQSVVDALESGQLAAGSAATATQANYLRWWITHSMDANPVIRQFVSVAHERKIAAFRSSDQAVRELATQLIRSRVRLQLQARQTQIPAAQFGIVRRELEKRARHKPVRQLLSEAGGAISALTPCLLMSPLSIAQYLPVEQPAFDLVIFDEASQITVWDAIGAIARGKQTIMVGDPKQLPPTQFFAAGQRDDDPDSDVEEDLASILDELLGANLPTLKLTWHYRSRHESLITFSNQHYYQGELHTFPSPTTLDSAVHVTYVGGRYDRGGSQTNPTEAARVVAEIERRLGDPASAGQTLGVVTFNQKQQALILDLLETARANNPDLEPYFAEDLEEPVFVKNLESVQGDERDVILFSTTFGPDEEGRIAMNFGPLNQQGGERRLNVAITRARCELQVITSLRSDHIDTTRTAALGVRDLQQFLSFAEQGRRAGAHPAPGTAAVGSAAQPVTPSPGLDAALQHALQARGWTVHRQVGAGQMRVDLGVVDPRNAGRYLAGIVTDGASYRQAATARDRDLVRPSVLKDLGWQLVTVWSVDYWLDPQGVVERVQGQLAGMLA